MNLAAIIPTLLERPDRQSTAGQFNTRWRDLDQLGRAAAGEMESFAKGAGAGRRLD